MKKVLCIALVIICCISLVACSNNLEKIEADIQGSWERVEDPHSRTKVVLEFSDGNVTKTQTVNGETETFEGTYVFTEDGEIVMSFADGVKQSVHTYASAEGGIFLWDIEHGSNYNKAN